MKNAPHLKSIPVSAPACYSACCAKGGQRWDADQADDVGEREVARQHDAQDWGHCLRPRDSHLYRTRYVRGRREGGGERGSWEGRGEIVILDNW